MSIRGEGIMGWPEIIILLFILIVVFLFCREIVCWYFKINERIKLLTDIRDIQKQQFLEPIKKD